jgi:hypothetical protein
MRGRCFAFGPFLDAGRASLLRDGAAGPLGNRALRVLVALVGARGGVVTKSELMTAGWPKAVVEESNLSVQIAALRKLLGPPPDGVEWIATVARSAPLDGRGGRRRSRTAAPALNTMPRVLSIAVLLFTNLSRVQGVRAFG